MSNLIDPTLVNDIKEILHQARTSVYQTINTTMTKVYWEIGRKIVEEEQNGKERAEYGKALIKNLAEELTKEFGKGFSVANLKNMRQFYLTFSKGETVLSTPCAPAEEGAGIGDKQVSALPGTTADMRFRLTKPAFTQIASGGKLPAETSHIPETISAS